MKTLEAMITDIDTAIADLDNARSNVAGLAIGSMMPNIDGAIEAIELASLRLHLQREQLENRRLQNNDVRAREAAQVEAAGAEARNVIALDAKRPAPKAKASKVIEIRNITSRGYKRQGTTYPGTVKEGQHADIAKGKSIRLFGVETNRYNGPESYDHTFKVGDTVVHGSYNLKYTGTITAIGAKTVSVDDGHGQTKRMSIYDFNFYNNTLDLEKVAKHNAQESQCI